jgi:hypothetical protein
MNVLSDFIIRTDAAYSDLDAKFVSVKKEEIKDSSSGYVAGKKKKPAVTKSTARSARTKVTKAVKTKKK